MKKKSPSSNSREVITFVQRELRKLADAEKAPVMAAYMKTTMPFYGVQKPDREPISKAIKKGFKPADRYEYEATLRALWELPYREEKYIALNYGCDFASLATIDTIPLYEEFVREGAWWDFVDVIAGHMVGFVYKVYRKNVEPVMDAWIEDDDFWIRRTAILSQLRHKKETDAKRLFRYCLSQADEKEFFIRKAIGWALREYSYADPAAVKKFLLQNKSRLSNLSFKEGAKHLVKVGQMEV